MNTLSKNGIIHLINLIGGPMSTTIRVFSIATALAVNPLTSNLAHAASADSPTAAECDTKANLCKSACTQTDDNARIACKTKCDDDGLACKQPVTASPTPEGPEPAPVCDPSSLTYSDVSAQDRKDICTPPPKPVVVKKPPPKPRALPTPPTFVINMNLGAEVEAAVQAALANGVKLTPEERGALLTEIFKIVAGISLEQQQELKRWLEKALEDDALKARKGWTVEGFVLTSVRPDPRVAPLPGLAGVKFHWRTFFRRYGRGYAKIGGWLGLRWGDFSDVFSEPGFAGGASGGFGLQLNDPKNEKVMLALETDIMSANAGFTGNGGFRGEFGGEKGAFTFRLSGGGGILPRQLTRRTGDDLRTALPGTPVFMLELGGRF